LEIRFDTDPALKKINQDPINYIEKQSSFRWTIGAYGAEYFSAKIIGSELSWDQPA
jgi:hypothetical protein